MPPKPHQGCNKMGPMRASACGLVIFTVLGLSACLGEQTMLGDGGSTLVTEAGTEPALPGAAATTLDATPPEQDAASTPFDAAASTPSDAAASAPFDAAQPQSAGDAAPGAVRVPGDAQLPSEAGSKTCPGSSSLKPGKASFEVMLNGLARSFAVWVPRTYTGITPVPLVIDFHGLHEGASLHELLSEWDDRVDQEGYVLAMPQGLDNAWNIGPCCTQSRDVDDEGFARAIVAHLSKAGCIDEQRVYATGYSNGGGMSHKLGCAAADVFAAIAPAAFDLLEEMDCKPSRPLSVFIFRGTEDPIVPYRGGPSTPPTLFYELPEIHFLGATKTFERWAQINHCVGTPTDTGAGCMTYSQCSAGVKVTLCTKQGGGHDPSDPDDAWPMLKAFSRP